MNERQQEQRIPLDIKLGIGAFILGGMCLATTSMIQTHYAPRNSLDLDPVRSSHLQNLSTAAVGTMLTGVAIAARACIADHRDAVENEHRRGPQPPPSP